MITWPRQPAHRNRRPDTATACPASQTLRRRTPSSAGYSSCIRARHGVGHGVDTELPGYDRRRACPQFCQAVAVMSSPLPAPPGEAHRPVGDGRRHSKNNVAIAPLGGRNGTPAPSMRGFSPPLTRDYRSEGKHPGKLHQAIHPWTFWGRLPAEVGLEITKVPPGTHGRTERERRACWPSLPVGLAAIFTHSWSSSSSVTGQAGGSGSGACPSIVSGRRRSAPR